MDGITSFGHWLKQRRRTLGLTQDDLARQVGCAVATIRKLEADERRPSAQIAERLADVLALAPHDRAAFLKSARAELAADRLPRPTQLPSALPSGTITFLFTDIAGSSRLWEQYPRAMSATLARYDAILCEAIAAHSGFVFKTIGDAVYAVFAHPANALAAALRAQRALHSARWSVTGLPPGQPVRVRMALHTGVVAVQDGDYVGQPLNRMARLLAAGHGSQTLISRATAELVRDDLPPGIELHDLGEHRLKDLIRPEHIFQLIAPDLPTDFPPLRTLDMHPTNVPAQSTPLIGRENEVAIVADLLRRADVRLLTLTGPGGVGKTRLALQVARELRTPFRDGVCFVALAPITDPALVAASIAQTLGLREHGGQPLVEQLKDYLRPKQHLLLLDNFEQILEAATLIAELLAAAPQLKVLVTSRAVLHLSGEQEFAVPPLALPDRQQLPPIETLSQYAAVMLFIMRARAARPDFAVTKATAPALAEICHRLDGLPLAIELAAARCKLFALPALLARLERRLPLLTGGARDLPARQQTLRDTIGWSYGLLDAGEQALFARLAVFVGGCTLQTVEMICGMVDEHLIDSSTAEGTAVWEGLMSLVDQSMVRRAEQINGEPRFEMLETIREYALERLTDRGEIEHVRERHAKYYLSLAEQIEPELQSAQQVSWLEQLDLEHGNLRAALEWALEHGVADVALRLGAALWRFWLIRGHLSEGAGWLEAALIYKNSVSASASVQARALHGAGILTHYRGDYTGAIVLHEQSLALRRALGDRQGIAKSLNSLGLIARDQHDLARAQICLEESLVLLRELEDTPNIPALLNNLGLVAHQQGDDERAAALYEESLALLREQGHTWGVALCLLNLGHVALQQKHAERATSLYQESMMLYQELGDKRSIAECLEGLADVARVQGHLLSAVRWCGSADALREMTGAPRWPDDQVRYDRVMNAARAHLDESTLEACRSEGLILPLEEVIAASNLSFAHLKGQVPRW